MKQNNGQCEKLTGCLVQSKLDMWSFLPDNSDSIVLSGELGLVLGPARLPVNRRQCVSVLFSSGIICDVLVEYLKIPSEELCNR